MESKKVIHRAGTRGHANHGWLDTYHTFSFADYYDPMRMRFGTLRVLNDDTVAAGMGFSTHPHDNMEIVSIPLEGSLEHRDSMGNISVIEKGEIQVMSAGTGITHSEYNKNTDKPVKFLQIWVFPEERNLPPRYSQIRIDEKKIHDGLTLIVSPEKNTDTAWIHQRAWFYMGELNKGHEITYNLKHENNGLYIFVLEGKLEADGTTLGTRDGMGISGQPTIAIRASSDVSVLLMEIPMS